MARNLVTPSVTGLEELHEKIEQILDRATAKEVKKIWMQAGLILRDAMRYLAPVAPGPITYYQKGQPPRTIQPGMLKAAIFAAYGDPAKPNILVGVNNTMAPHGHWIEFGNVRIPPQPYMRPALSTTRTACVEAMAAGYRRLLLGDGQIAEPTAPDGEVDPPTETFGDVREMLSNPLAAKRIAAIQARAIGVWRRRQA